MRTALADLLCTCLCAWQLSGLHAPGAALCCSCPSCSAAASTEPRRWSCQVIRGAVPVSAPNAASARQLILLGPFLSPACSTSLSGPLSNLLKWLPCSAWGISGVHCCRTAGHDGAEGLAALAAAASWRCSAAVAGRGGQLQRGLPSQLWCAFTSPCAAQWRRAAGSGSSAGT